MQKVDLNLLQTLDVLIEEQSVGRTAERLGMSAPSVSRLLARAREMLGDPILVRAGRKLVATEHARTLHAGIRHVLSDAQALLLPGADFRPERLERRFTIRANDGFSTAFTGALSQCLAERAPRTTLRFAPEHENDDDALREGRIDLYIGASRTMGPEVRIQTIFRDSVVGLARPGHPIFAANITPERFAGFRQISVSRRGRAFGPIDDALAEHGLTRPVPLVVPSFLVAVAALPGTDLIALIPHHVLRTVRILEMDLRTFDLPVPVETIVMAQAWHPRFDSDAAHRFLRQCVREVCADERRDGP